MQLEIHVKTNDRTLAPHIMGTDDAGNPRKEIRIPGDARLIHKGEVSRMMEALGAEPALQGLRFVLEIIGEHADNILVGLLTAWLYDRFKGGRAQRIAIGNTEVEIEESKIERLLTEKLKSVQKEADERPEE